MLASFIHESQAEFVCKAQIQLIRIELRVPEYGWTTQKVFHLMNFIVNGGDCSVFLYISMLHDCISW